MVKNNQIFDRNLLKNNLDRFSSQLINHNFLFKEISNRIYENVLDFKQDFSNILEINAQDGFLGRKIAQKKNCQNLIQTNFCHELNKAYPENSNNITLNEENLCFKENSFDLVINNLSLHFINDVLANLFENKQILKENGVFIGFFFGGQTLKELREIFNKAEIEIYNRISPRIIPFIDVKDAGMLAQKAGFKNIISDNQNIEVSYNSLLKLMQDLRNMGLGNILFDRNKEFLNKKMLFLMENLIKDLYNDGNEDFISTFEVITITAFN